MDTMYIVPAIRLQCTLADHWQPEFQVQRFAQLSDEELLDALYTLVDRGQVELMWDTYAQTKGYRQGHPERFIKRRHPGLTDKLALAAAEYALPRGLFDEDIQAELDALNTPEVDNDNITIDAPAWASEMPSCIRCKCSMRLGIALHNQLACVTFDSLGSTYSHIGRPHLTNVWKCPECGRSITKAS